jgi:DNA polymerase III epsilon subunit-like protein
MKAAKFLFLDCETTGLPANRYFSTDDVDGWPRLVQIAWGVYDGLGNAEEARCYIIRPEGFTIPADAIKIHGITNARALREGRELAEVLGEFLGAFERSGGTPVAHNLDFDFGVVGGELVRTRLPLGFLEKRGICTMKTTTDLCRLPRPSGFGFKWPTLEDLHLLVFGFPYSGAHDAASDLDACARCFFKLLQAGHY